MSEAGRQRIVVTGLGPLTAIGVGRVAFAEGLRAGHEGVGPIKSFDAAGFPQRIGGEVEGYGRLGRTTELCIAAARLALADAGLTAGEVKGAPVVLGTTDGEPLPVEALVEAAVRGGAVDASQLFGLQPADRLSLGVSRALGLGGEAVTLTTACAAGNYALGYALDILRSGDADVALCGGGDSFCRKTFAGFFRLGAVAPEHCAPFDRDRKGMIPAEGAGILVLETLERARARGARIYAELLGYGLTCDAAHMVAPNADSIVRCIRLAHADAGVSPQSVDYVCAHGTGTKLNDTTETAALRAVFGDAIPPVSSIKSMLGHTMGAASALGAIASCLALTEGFLPPTINFATPDPACALDCIPNVARAATPRVVQNHGFAFGGNNAVVLLGRAP